MLTTRTIDLFVAVVGLATLAIPIALLILACRLSTGSSGLFKQIRLGEHGRPFQLVKLRTLRTDLKFHPASREAASCATPLGRILRKSKLDEIPQLWNVIKGDMSLIGPRPIIPDEYTSRSHYDRLVIRPGLSGLWQLSEARWRPFDDNPEYDRFYLAHRCLLLDLWLLWRTALLVFAGRETKMQSAIFLFGQARFGSRRRSARLRPAVGWKTGLITLSMLVGLTLLSTLASSFAG